jgi:hypothetical protein
MAMFEGSHGDIVQHCAGCGGLWLPGDVLHELNDRARRLAGNDERFPITNADGFLIGPAALTAGFDPEVVDELLITSASVWLQ